MSSVRQAMRIAPGRPAAMLGVRTALATTVPLLLSPWLGSAAAAWGSAGGYCVSLVDKGGSYGARARIMGAVTLGGTAAVALGALASTHPAAAVLSMFACAAVCALAALFGPAAASGGTTVAVLFAISVAIRAGAPHEALSRAAAILGSGAWSMALALLLWPVRLYQPARQAVANAFRALAAGGPHATMREAIESARGVLAATRRGRRGESGRGEALLALLEDADLIFAGLIALEDVIAGAVAAGAPEPPLQGALRQVRTSLAEMVPRIESERPLADAPPVPWSGEALRAAIDPAAPAPLRAEVEHAAALVDRLRSLTALGFNTTSTLYSGRPPRSAGPLAAEPPPGVLQRLRDDLTPGSVVVRHALRVGLTAAAAVAIARWAGLQRGYWVTVTVLVLMQPYAPATSLKALQRVAGTVGGGVLAALLLAGLPKTAVPIVAIVLAGASAAVLQLNYALFSFFVAITFVLLAELSGGDWHLAEVRIIDTLAGGALALAGARLWRHRERKWFPDEMAAAIAALRAYLAEAARVLLEGVPLPAPSLWRARRRLGLRLLTAEASFERLLAERPPPAAQEAAMALISFARRCGSSVNAAASVREIAPAHEDAVALRELSSAAGAMLADIEEALRQGRKPPPLPGALEDGAARVRSPLIAAPVRRLVHQLGVLHDAAGRYPG